LIEQGWAHETRMVSGTTESEWKYKGLGKKKTASCGCVVISYPGGKIVYT
jgi:hypothetical protein